MNNWLTQLNGKSVDKIYQIGFDNNYEDIFLPALFFITFKDLNKFLEIDGDFEGNQIRINLINNSEFDQKLKENDLSTESDSWKVSNCSPEETLGKLLGQKIDFVEYGIGKEEFKKGVFEFITFICKNLELTIFETSTTGLYVTENPKVKLNFEKKINIYSTK